MPRRRTRSKRARNTGRNTRRRPQRGGAVNNIREWMEATVQKREGLLGTDYSISQIRSSDLQFLDSATGSSESLSVESTGDFGLTLPDQLPKDIRRIMVRVKELLTNPTTQNQYDRGELVQFLTGYGNVDLARSRTPEFSDIHFLNDVEVAIREQIAHEPIKDFTITTSDIKSQLPLFIEFLAANANPEDEKLEIPLPFQGTTQPSLPE